MPRSIVVGVDGSDTARRAFEAAIRLAALDGSTVVAVHAVGLTDEVDGARVPSFGHRPELASAMAEWCADDRVHVETRLVEGPPVDVLLRVADEIEASAIVVGRRGLGGRPDLRLGSTAHQVLERADCPVLVVPPTDRR